MRTGERVTTTIEAVAFGGDGVGRVGQMVVFVPFTVDGDCVEAEITTARKRYARGSLRKIITPSHHRVAPVCSHYGRCGGCQYQHISYPHQLTLKEQQVKDAFVRIGKVNNPPIRKILPSPAVYRYRGKAEFHILRRRGQPPQIGFMDTTGARIVDIDMCAIAEDSINDNLARLQKTIAAGAKDMPEERLILWSGDSAEEIPADGGGGEPRRVVRVVREKKLFVPFRGFFQANNALIDRLVEEVIGACKLGGREVVIDCYCGSGLFSLFLAPDAAAIFGIEWNGDAVHCARLNGENAGITHARFIEGDVAEVLALQFIRKNIHPDVAVLDPPRTGLSPEALSAIARLNPHRLVYVSCNPATQARDIRHLLDHGFILQYLQPFDLFPQTGHIEVLGLLEASSGPDIS